MSSERDELLDAVIGHLDELKRRGTRYISLSPESLTVLDELAQPATGARPRPTPIPSKPQTPARSLNSPQQQSTSPGPPLRPAAADRSASPPPPPPSATHPTPDQRTPAAAPVGTAAKIEALQELRERALVCMKCPNLAAARTNVVFGVGSVDAELMFVGEAPGADEDRQGEPFVGAAGQLLTKIIQTMGLSRETVYIGNILKCRPDTPGQASGNRKPTPEEMKTCIPYLHSQIDIIRPRALVALGATAVEGLLGNIGGITKVRGHWREYRGIPLMPTFHPAYLLRNMALSEKRKVWEDMLQVMERLGLPISDKQRGFFLPKD